MQLSDHLYVLLLDLLLVVQLLVAGGVEPVVEELRVAEDLRQEEVQQTPQLV